MIHETRHRLIHLRLGLRHQRLFGTSIAVDMANVVGARPSDECARRANRQQHAFARNRFGRIDRRCAGERHRFLEAGTRGIAPDHLRQYAHIAAKIGSPIVRCVIDTNDHQPDAQEIIKTLKEVLPAFEKQGVTLAIENHDRFQAKTLANLMLALRGAPIGICLDVANSLGREEPMRHVVETLAPFTVNLHIKEYVIKRLPSYQGFVVHGAPFSQGMCDLDWLLPYLKANTTANFNVILEQWAPAQATVEDTIALEERWARESIAYLQRKYFPSL